eukprot:852717-Pleurochrysis_carterae.AAC.1
MMRLAKPHCDPPTYPMKANQESAHQRFDLHSLRARDSTPDNFSPSPPRTNSPQTISPQTTHLPATSTPPPQPFPPHEAHSRARASSARP